MIDFLFEKKIFSIILFVFLIFSGIFAYFQIPRNEDPGYKIRTCAITATLSGISPIDADNFIAKKTLIMYNYIWIKYIMEDNYYEDDF